MFLFYLALKGRPILAQCNVCGLDTEYRYGMQDMGGVVRKFRDSRIQRFRI